VFRKKGQALRPEDDLNSFVGKMTEAEGTIIGSNLFANVSTEVKALIDRAASYPGQHHS